MKLNKEEVKKVPQTINLPLYLYRRLIQENELTGKSLSEIVRAILEERFGKAEHEYTQGK